MFIYHTPPRTRRNPYYTFFPSLPNNIFVPYTYHTFYKHTRAYIPKKMSVMFIRVFTARYTSITRRKHPNHNCPHKRVSLVVSNDRAVYTRPTLSRLLVLFFASYWVPDFNGINDATRLLYLFALFPVHFFARPKSV